MTSNLIPNLQRFVGIAPLGLIERLCSLLNTNTWDQILEGGIQIIYSTDLREYSVAGKTVTL